MSDDQIKLWNEKVEAGQLNRDSDITRIANSMKSAMRALVGDSGLTLEKIGIKPVADYAGNLNGTFTIDDTKLTKALQDNSQGVMDMFTSTPDSTAVTDSQKYSQTGLINRLQDILYKEVKKTDSPLLKKAGLEGTASVVNNTLTKSISDYEKKIADMQKSLTTREQALYSKYATLETMLTNYNSQQSSLTSMLGGN
jgi:flagellar hook-associated protein 2